MHYNLKLIHLPFHEFDLYIIRRRLPLLFQLYQNRLRSISAPTCMPNLPIILWHNICWTLEVAVGTGWYGCTIGYFTTGTTLGTGVARREIVGNNGVRISTAGNIGDNGKAGKRDWFLLICKIFSIWLIKWFVASPYENNGSVFSGSLLITIMLLMACWS